jgi:uncharacterized protein (TIGR02453 family)
VGKYIFKTDFPSTQEAEVFAGFPAEAIPFFRSLARHNRREWFQPRKRIYEERVKAPMIELVDAINARLLSFAPDHVNEPRQAIYRIYRDTRFSSDKTPYKTHIAAIFPRRGHEKHASAGFYVGVSPEGIEVAGGLYRPEPEDLVAVRTWLAAHHVRFRAAARKPAKLLGELHGESLQRVPKGFVPTHPAADLLKMRQWLYYTTLDVKLATSSKLLTEIVRRYRAMAPVVAMLNAPLDKRRAAALRDESFFD